MTEAVTTSLEESEIRLTKKGLNLALKLGHSMGMAFNLEEARQFLIGYFAAIDNFHNPNESERNKNTVTLYLLKETLLNPREK